ncbi:MAG: VCBS repeat-containing protein [Planctomycetota bacterium]|nr:VCBS repeat-containing protein [Planctomycetota bacterium]
MKITCTALVAACVAGLVGAQSGFSSLQRITAMADRPTAIATGDLDGDGRIDVLSASSLDNKFAWYRNRGMGAFQPQQVISTTGARPQALQAADLDLDGDLDVLAVSSSDDKIAWYENRGQGVFGRETVLSTAFSSPWSVRAVDVDGDGDLDVLVGCLGGTGQLVWFENVGFRAGSLTFAAPRSVAPSVPLPIDVLAGDLDGDGDQDILVSSGGVLGVAWFPNLGNGSFGPGRVIANVSASYRSPAIADIDGDARVDVLTTMETGAELAWHRNLGGGRFGPSQQISNSIAGCRSVTTADFDLDGDVDVAAIGSGAFNQVGWFENLGQGRFGSLRAIEAGNSPFIVGGVAILAEDVSEDGRPDLLVAASTNDVVGWYKSLLATAESYGAGCGRPSLTQRMTARPVMGAPAAIEIQNVQGALCVVMAGLDRSLHPAFGSLPFDLSPLGMTGCALLQSGEVPAVPAISTTTPGVFTWSMPIATNVAFEGLRFYTQAFAPAPGLNPLGLASSNGIDWRIGR